MQFHLNGFRPGNPEISEAVQRHDEREIRGGSVEEVDVLIVGCGPAGLTLAAQLAVFPDIKTRIVEQKPGPLQLGQADGVACRTMEMFEAFGFSERVLKEAYWVNETSFWKPDDNQRANIVRSGRIQDTEDGLSEFPHVILNQARVHDFYLDVMKNSPSRLEPYYSRRLIDLNAAPVVHRAIATHSVTANFERLDPGHEGEFEVIKARFVVGCDGARSTVRKSIGRTLRGDSANQAWGVMDVLAVTDFPDIRIKAAIQSANEGSILIIPREGGYMVRMYIELDKLGEAERVAGRNIDITYLIAAACRILHPYSLEVKEVVWWSVYDIGQRLCDKFDNAPDSHSPDSYPSVFIAGDACHTHSPKAGQGMNVSMQDGFNLGWKLAAVIRGQCSPEILHSYSAERHAVAAELIEFDRKFHKMFSSQSKELSKFGSESVDPAEFQKYFIQHGRFTAGTATRYQPSIITDVAKYQQLAEGFVVGMRFHSARVIRLADAKVMQLGHTIKADGRWRIFAFAAAGDHAAPSLGIGSLCAFLGDSPESPVRRYTPAGRDYDSVIDFRVIFQQSHRDLTLETMPTFLLPKKGRYGLIDYEKLLGSKIRNDEDIFDVRSIDRDKGCLVIVRPDQFVAHILPLNAYSELSEFFGRFFCGCSSRL